MKEVFGLFLLQKIIHCPVLHQRLVGHHDDDDDDDDHYRDDADCDDVANQGCLQTVDHDNDNDDD